MTNTLTTQAGLRIGPIVLETLLKHYFERFKSSQNISEGSTLLRKEELLYDEAFNVVKAFLEAASYSTVEEVQAFANTKTPSPPWVHVVRLLVPMSSCDEAAKVLIKALGGEDEARRVAGGVKWWQVRGVEGVDAQWITAKEDWKEARKREKAAQGTSDHSAEENRPADVYESEMDEMKCILYSHGGGYYFGSVDQERYSIQRHARKINGRVFAINYRLAPQYPFPCALQDIIAAYLFLINPPKGALHRPVKPSNIIIMGDSAGGGLSLALLQVIRDVGLPEPAGGVLISPWCDLSHSFQSIHTNTATDVIPEFGLSLQKPSPLWPPPSQEMSRTLRSTLRQRLKQTFHPLDRHSSPLATPVSPLVDPLPSMSSGAMPVDIGTITHIPSIDAKDQTIRLPISNGEVINITDQLHLYAQNGQVLHPLISSSMSYLGGLPPLLFIASDGEVLRDEIIYTAHKAAYPEKFPIKDETRAMYPALNGIETRHGRTPVHLQVYDDCAHVLPVLFSFTTPAKYCYRAVASFARYVTGAPQKTASLPSAGKLPRRALTVSLLSSSSPGSVNSRDSDSQAQRTGRSVRKALSVKILRRPSFLSNHRNNTEEPPPLPNTPIVAEPFSSAEDGTADVSAKGDVAGPRFKAKPSPAASTQSTEVRTAGEPIIYSETPEFPSMRIAMIRERVSTRGIIRPLEPEQELAAMKVPQEAIGTLSERVARRYLTGKEKFDKKFPNAHKNVEKQRKKNLQLAKKEAEKHSNQLQKQSKLQQETHSTSESKDKTTSSLVIEENITPGSTARGWAWFMDGKENPPPSSITARQDTTEARRLAKIADQAVLAEGHSFTGNNMWSTIVEFLTASSGPPGLTRTSEKKDQPA
jgi:acetyl esterase/lipase